MYTAKIIRHRHSIHTFINDHLVDKEDDIHWKIIFSHPDEYERFKAWVKENDGEYKYNKDDNKNKGELPGKIELLFGIEATEDICWCDVMQYFLLHVADYKFHSTLNPYKGEFYVRE